MTVGRYPKKASEWVGRKVASVCELKNGHCILPAGTIFRVVRKYGTLELISQRCPTCGIRMRITRVPISSVEVID